MTSLTGLVTKCTMYLLNGQYCTRTIHLYATSARTSAILQMNNMSGSCIWKMWAKAEGKQVAIIKMGETQTRKKNRP